VYKYEDKISLTRVASPGGCTALHKSRARLPARLRVRTHLTLPLTHAPTLESVVAALLGAGAEVNTGEKDGGRRS